MQEAVSNRSAYVKSNFEFEVKHNPVDLPGHEQILVKIAACSVCGTDMHIADRLASKWQPFGHEVSGTVIALGDGVHRFSVGDRVGLDSSAPCGKCDVCLPKPYGRQRPDLCPTPSTYWDSATMGFGQYLLTPHQCAVSIPDSMSFETAALVEPVGVSIDLCETAGIQPGDSVLVIGPGPLGLGAVAIAKAAGASKIILAGRSHSRTRLKAGEALGADEIIFTDRSELATHDFGSRKPNKVLVTAPPSIIPQAMAVTEFGGTVAYIGIAFGPAAVIEFDADAFHFNKLSLKASHASPGTHAANSVAALERIPAITEQLLTHRFSLDEISSAMIRTRDDTASVVKSIMINS